MSECIFCKIVAGHSPSSQVYEDESVVAFLDIRPVNPGHLLVVPKRHASALMELDEATGGHLFKIGMRLAATLRQSGLRCEGVNFFLADGEAAFQDVFHVHLHVIPRFRGDAFHVTANWDEQPDRAQLEQVAARLRMTYVQAKSTRQDERT